MPPRTAQKTYRYLPRFSSGQRLIEQQAIDEYESVTGKRKKFIRRDVTPELLADRLIHDCEFVTTQYILSSAAHRAPQIRKTFDRKPISTTIKTFQQLFEVLQQRNKFATCLAWGGTYHVYRPYFGMLKLDPTTDLIYTDSYLFEQAFGPIPTKFRMHRALQCGVGKESQLDAAWCVNPYHVTFNLAESKRGYLDPEHFKTLKEWNEANAKRNKINQAALRKISESKGLRHPNP